MDPHTSHPYEIFFIALALLNQKKFFGEKKPNENTIHLAFD